MASKDLLKGMLKPIILKLLSEKGKMYGYEITQLAKEISGGEIELTFGALYPVLHKLELELFVDFNILMEFNYLLNPLHSRF